MTSSASDYPVLHYLQQHVVGATPATPPLALHYPTAVSRLLGLEVVAVALGQATIALEADAARHGNQQGTVHGGMLAELADAAIGTAHSTVLQAGESFTSLGLQVTFLRPVWRERLLAEAWANHQGRTVSHYHGTILRADGKAVATFTSAVMTLRGAQAQGR